jgi:hypothetical protein
LYGTNENASRFGSNGNVSLKGHKFKPYNLNPPISGQHRVRLEWGTWEGSSFVEGFFASLE